MSRAKELVTAAGTLACALGIGLIMQSSDTASQRYGTSNSPSQPQSNPATAIAPQVQSEVNPEQQQVEFIEVEDIMLTSALPAITAMSTVTASKTVENSKPSAQPVGGTETASPSCDVIANATPEAAATVRLDVLAPCHPSERVTIHHSGMFFTEKTNASGGLSLRVPGLAEKAVYIFAFGDGQGALAQTELTSVSDVNRVVLQWRGRTAGFELHAREFGAEYGSEGHVWRGAENLTMGRLIDGTGGYLHSLGNVDVPQPHIAEIYSFPANMSGRNGQIDLSVEAEVTTQNCGLEIEAETLEHRGTGRLHAQSLTLAMPGCDAIGDYLVLNNVLEDMKVAAQ